MKKGFIACIVSTIFLVALPFQVKGEEKDRNRGLLGETIIQLVSATEEVVDTVKTNINQTIPSQSSLNPVTEVEEQNIPFIEHVVSEVSNTTDTTVNNLVNVVEESVENLPKVPIVTSELKVTVKRVGKVTTEVQKTVNTGGKAVIDIAEKVKEKKLDNTLSEEINITKLPLTPTPTKQSNNVYLVESEPTFSHIKNPDGENNKASKVTEAHFENTESPEIERKLEKLTKKNAVNSEVNISNDAVKTNEIINTFIKLVEAKKMINVANTTFPVGPDQTAVVTSSAVTPGSSNVTLSGVSFLLGGDMPIVLLTSHEMLKELARKKWYHKNSYAIIQWIHTPLRKPPEALLFHM